MPDRFEHHLREAVETLQYYRKDTLDQLLAMYCERWPRGLSHSIFNLGEILPLLSEKGLADPHYAQKATYLRAHFNLRREEFDQQEHQWSEFASRLTFWARSEWLCELARVRDQSSVIASERWQLPLPDCGQEWCPCHWTITIDPL